MTYNGTLTMPATFAVVCEEEMTYVEGGFYYMDNSECCALLAAIGLTVSANAGAIATAITAAGSGGLAAIASSIPVLGWVVSIVGAGYLIAQGKEFAESLCTAVQRGIGVDISVGWYWFVPRLKFTAC